MSDPKACDGPDSSSKEQHPWPPPSPGPLVGVLRRQGRPGGWLSRRNLLLLTAALLAIGVAWVLDAPGEEVSHMPYNSVIEPSRAP